MNKNKVAVILFNLGGPNSLKSVKQFLFNLFNDKNIIPLPKFLRYFLAKIIAHNRDKKASKIYSLLGGMSPILENTMQQAEALQKRLEKHGDFKVFTVMRYWHPMSDEVIKDVEKYSPDEIVLLPLYPQFSTSTTWSSIEDWRSNSKKLKAKEHVVCCYYKHQGFIDGYIDLIRPALKDAQKAGAPRLLFSAHGLPVRNIENGDPYKWQIEESVKSIMSKIKNVDYRICYQSRVGRLEWISPYTEDEIIRAGKDSVPVVLVPISFVSEHSETLVELDIEYKKLADESGVPLYIRVPTVSTNEKFISGLEDLCVESLEDNGCKNYCLSECGQCFCRMRNGS
jgi:ferrochelatase